MNVYIGLLTSGRGSTVCRPFSTAAQAVAWAEREFRASNDVSAAQGADAPPAVGAVWSMTRLEAGGIVQGLVRRETLNDDSPGPSQPR